MIIGFGTGTFRFNRDVASAFRFRDMGSFVLALLHEDDMEASRRGEEISRISFYIAKEKAYQNVFGK